MKFEEGEVTMLEDEVLIQQGHRFDVDTIYVNCFFLAQAGDKISMSEKWSHVSLSLNYQAVSKIQLVTIS